MGPLAMAAIQAAPSIGQLLIGENSLFSGKKRLASRELKKNFDASQSMGIGSKYYDYLKNMQSQAQQGIGDAARALYSQQAGRAQSAALGALSGRRAALGGIGSVVANAGDNALEMATMDENLRRQGQQAANQALFNIAGLEQQNELRKRQEAADYWGNQRQESDASISSALQGIGNAVGSAFKLDAMKTPAGGGMNLGGGQQALQIMPVSSLPKAPFSGLSPKTYGSPLLGVTPRPSASQRALSNSLLRKPLY